MTRRRGRCRVGPGQHGRSGAVAQAGEGVTQDLYEDRERLERMRAALDLVQGFPAGPLARAKVKQLQNLCQTLNVPVYGAHYPMPFPTNMWLSKQRWHASMLIRHACTGKALSLLLGHGSTSTCMHWCTVSAQHPGQTTCLVTKDGSIQQPRVAGGVTVRSSCQQAPRRRS